MAKIGILTPYLNYFGGVESITALLKKALESRGNVVQIIAGDQFKITPLEKQIVPLVGEPFIFAPYFLKELHRFDAVVCNGEYGFGIKHPRCINLFHGSAYGYRKAVQEHLGPLSSLVLYRTQFFQQWGAKKKTIVCVSNFLETLLKEQGIQVDRVIENGVDLSVFTKQQRAPAQDKYLFVGSLDFIGKGFDILQKLTEKGMKIDCVTEKKPPDPLGWITPMPNHVMPHIYSRYKILLFPSRFEGMSMAPLEAMACGLPVVISPVGLGEKLKSWIPEFVAKSFEPQEYYEKAKHLEGNYDFFSQKAIDYVHQHHSFNLFADKWNSLISSLLN